MGLTHPKAPHSCLLALHPSLQTHPALVAPTFPETQSPHCPPFRQEGNPVHASATRKLLSAQQLNISAKGSLKHSLPHPPGDILAPLIGVYLDRFSLLSAPCLGSSRAPPVQGPGTAQGGQGEEGDPESGFLSQTWGLHCLGGESRWVGVLGEGEGCPGTDEISTKGTGTVVLSSATHQIHPGMFLNSSCSDCRTQNHLNQNLGVGAKVVF